MSAAIVAGRDRMDLDNGMQVRLLSALEVLRARREAEELAQEERERPLCSNACLLSRALERDGGPVFDSGRAALAGMSAREIRALAGRWAAFDRGENPSPENGEEAAMPAKKAWGTRLMSAFAGVCSGRSTPFPRRTGRRI